MSDRPASVRGMPEVERLTAGAARRIALAAQGFTDPRPTGRVDARHLRRVLDRVALLQIDSVNVLSRSHYLPVFARLGAYPRELLDRLTGFTAGPVQRETFEYWAHEASILPLRLHPLLRWRMERAADEAWGGMREARDSPGLLDQVRAMFADGPVRAADTGLAPPRRDPGQMWNWHVGKQALEFLFWSGEVTAARRVNFERLYDLTGRVLPPDVVGAPTPSREDAHLELLRISARALGVATEPDLGDYFRLPRAESKLRVAELVEAGELHPVEVAGWGRTPAYLWPAARRPRRVSVRALLSPFDSLVWFRPRTERLFGMRYRLEIYTPAPQRQYGYYVLPFLLGDRLVARVDLKADRQAGVLRVQGSFAEPDVAAADVPRVVSELAVALREMADWLGLDDVVAARHGDLAAPLAVALSV